MTPREQIQRIINDPAASDLLRFICMKNLHRDPIQAANELAVAAEVFAALADETLLGVFPNADDGDKPVAVRVLPDGTLAI
jgi:hypothetical protein